MILDHVRVGLPWRSLGSPSPMYHLERCKALRVQIAHHETQLRACEDLVISLSRKLVDSESEVIRAPQRTSEALQHVRVASSVMALIAGQPGGTPLVDGMRRRMLDGVKGIFDADAKQQQAAKNLQATQQLLGQAFHSLQQIETELGQLRGQLLAAQTALFAAMEIASEEAAVAHREENGSPAESCDQRAKAGR